MRVVGVLALFLGIIGSASGLAYAAFTTLREWSVLHDDSIAIAGPSTVRVPAKSGRPYWAAIELTGPVHRTPNDGVNHDIAMKARVLDASGAVLRTVDVHLDANKKLPTCLRFASDDGPCALIFLEGRTRDRIRMTLQIAPVTTTTSGDLTYEIDVGKDPRGGVVVESAKLTVYRTSREEANAGLIVALITLVLGGVVFRVTRRA